MVSIVIPVYQVSDYIERCICSVMAQTYTNIECIIVDDATKDDSIDKIERLLKKYVGPIRFSILHHNVNRGLSAARNTGTKNAKGDYVFYLDGDDEITSNCIKDLLNIALEHPDAEVVIGNHIRYTDEGEFVHYQENVPVSLLTNDDVFSFFEHNLLPIAAWNKLIRRSFLLKNNLTFIEGIVWEDMPWMFMALKKLSKLYVCKTVTYHYYIRPNSIVTGTDNLSVGKNYCVIYDLILHNLTPGRESRELNIYVERFCKRYIEHRQEIPEYYVLMKEFRDLSRAYGNKTALRKLDVAKMMSKLPVRASTLQKVWQNTHRRRGENLVYSGPNDNNKQ